MALSMEEVSAEDSPVGVETVGVGAPMTVEPGSDVDVVGRGATELGVLPAE